MDIPLRNGVHLKYWVVGIGVVLLILGIAKERTSFTGNQELRSFQLLFKLFGQSVVGVLAVCKASLSPDLRNKLRVQNAHDEVLSRLLESPVLVPVFRVHGLRNCLSVLAHCPDSDNRRVSRLSVILSVVVRPFDQLSEFPCKCYLLVSVQILVSQQNHSVLEQS